MGTGRRFKVVTIRGIPIYISLSWLVIVGLFFWLQYTNFTIGPFFAKPSEALKVAAASSVLFFGGVLLHEAAHAWVSRRFDLPVLGITLVFWGGATETRANSKGPLAEFLVSFAGPFTTLSLAVIFWVVARQMHPGIWHDMIALLARWNLLFAGLNALPGFPLDGGRMLLSATWGATHDRRTALKVAGWGGIAVGVAFFVWAIYQFTIPRGDIGTAFFFVYIGVVLIGTGRAMPQRIALRDRLHVGTVADAMRDAPESLAADATLMQALDHVLRTFPDQSFPVVDGGRVVGTVSMASARRVGGRDPMRPVRDGMLPLSQTPIVKPEDPLDDALEWMSGRDAIVLDHERLVGAIGPPDVERWFRGRYDGDRNEPPVATIGGHVVPPRPDL
ncbi:MAG: site-2 protease family protein [Actinomycetota bacterium]